MPEHKRFKDEFHSETGVRWRPWRWFFAAVGVCLVIAATFWIVGWVTQPARTAAGVRERIGNPDNVLYQYEHFHDLCAAVSSTDSKISAKEREIAAYDKRHPDGDEGDKFQAVPKRDRLDTELTGLQQFRADNVAEYNADSAKYNRALFKDKSLPYRLDDTTPVCN